MLYLLELSLLFSVASSGNILVTVGTYGSHLYTSALVAEFLVDAGHNVTLLSLFEDVNVDMTARKFHWHPVAKREESKNELESVNDLVEQLIDFPSKNMMVDMFGATESALKRSEGFFLKGYEYFTGESFIHMLEQGNFDLVIVEDTSVGAFYHLITKDVPVIGLTCTSDVAFLRSKEGYPILQVSEPNTLLVGNFPPTFKERWDAIMRLFSIIKYFGSVFMNHPELSKVGMDELERVPDIRFYMDHPAVGFPYLVPRNAFSLGFFHLNYHKPSPIPGDINQFLANCPHESNVYFSFGSFFSNIAALKQIATMLDVLTAADICLILKFSGKIEDHYDLPSSKVLVKPWIPQKDLLGSGKINFFISHCGNNGRLESIYYNVPLLCIPLFADQFHNAVIMAKKQFGIMLLKEDLNEDSFSAVVDKMIKEQHQYSKNMREATETVVDDPGSGAAVLKYHVNHLLKYGNADYLRNSMIKQQSVVEMYNLDILMISLLIVLSFLTCFLVCMFKIVKCVYRRITKTKKE